MPLHSPWPHHVGMILQRGLVHGLQDPNQELVPRLVVGIPYASPQTVDVPSPYPLSSVVPQPQWLVARLTSKWSSAWHLLGS